MEGEKGWRYGRRGKEWTASMPSTFALLQDAERFHVNPE